MSKSLNSIIVATILLFAGVHCSISEIAFAESGKGKAHDCCPSSQSSASPSSHSEDGDSSNSDHNCTTHCSACPNCLKISPPDNTINIKVPVELFEHHVFYIVRLDTQYITKVSDVFDRNFDTVPIKPHLVSLNASPNSPPVSA